MRTRWNRDLVIRRIKQKYRAGEKLNSDYLYRHESSLVQAGIRYFGSWGEAIRKAGLDYSRIKIVGALPRTWNKDRVTSSILELHARGEKINQYHIEKTWHKLYDAGTRYFGTWSAAVEAAGLDASKISRYTRWNKRRVLVEIRKRKKQGLPIHESAVEKSDPSLCSAAGRHFGFHGWTKALKALGLRPKGTRRIWTKEKVTTEIKELAAKGHALNYNALTETHRRLITGGLSAFGSWPEAVKSAGFNYNEFRLLRWGYWSKSRIIRKIRRLNKKGVDLSPSGIAKTDLKLMSITQYYFGSWKKAVLAAGVDYFRHRRNHPISEWVDKLTKAELKDLEIQIRSISRRKTDGSNAKHPSAPTKNR